jgi:hypothetical protein
MNHLVNKNFLNLPLAESEISAKSNIMNVTVLCRFVTMARKSCSIRKTVKHKVNLVRSRKRIVEEQNIEQLVVGFDIFEVLLIHN